MKTSISTIILFLLLNGLYAKSQGPAPKPILTVLSVDSRGVNTDPLTMGSMVRTELEKLPEYNVTDKYDVIQFMEANKVSLNNCFGKSCLTEVGLMMKSDKMFSGSIEHFGKILVFTYRLIDVKNSEVEKTYVHEFLYLPEEILNMVKLSVADMFAKPYDVNLMNKLSKPFELDNSNNNPKVERLALDGPRMGAVSFSGDLRQRISDPRSDGGFDAYPIMFQFGYQFEKQYLNEGNLQALFEFIPMVTGLDQGHFIPSVALMHGLRSNVNGWEFAFGPTFNVIPFAKGYYDANNNWHLQNDWYSDPARQNETNPYEISERVDRRGTYRIHSSFVLAAGRTFRSGKLNIPVNVFVVPGKNGWRYGISFGFNAKNK